MAIRSSEMSLAIYQSTKRTIPQDQYPYHYVTSIKSTSCLCISFQFN